MISKKQLIIIFSLSALAPVASVLNLDKDQHEVGVGNDACKTACRQKFEVGSFGTSDIHVWDLGSLDDSCERGCRFFSIVELINKSSDYINTLKLCSENCRDAYLGRYHENEACRNGCNQQKPFKMKTTIKDEKAPRAGSRSNIFSILYPIMRMRNLYKSMRQASWSFFMVHDKEENSEDLLIIQTNPRINSRDRNSVDHLFSKKYSPGFNETGALRNSQLKATSSPHNRFSIMKWWTSLPQNSGMPGAFVCILLLLPAVALIWLCMSAAETAPDHRMKLSIKSEDLDGIQTLLAEHPQAAVASGPLLSKMVVSHVGGKS